MNLNRNVKLLRNSVILKCFFLDNHNSETGVRFPGIHVVADHCKFC